MKIGSKIKELRRESNLTQKELAELLMIDRSIISKYESNNRIPEIQILIRIAKYFKVSIGFLSGMED